MPEDQMCFHSAVSMRYFPTPVHGNWARKHGGEVAFLTIIPNNHLQNFCFLSPRLWTLLIWKSLFPREKQRGKKPASLGIRDLAVWGAISSQPAPSPQKSQCQLCRDPPLSSGNASTGRAASPPKRSESQSCETPPPKNLFPSSPTPRQVDVSPSYHLCISSEFLLCLPGPD